MNGFVTAFSPYTPNLNNTSMANISLTSYCNRHCNYCFAMQSMTQLSHANMDLETPYSWGDV